MKSKLLSIFFLSVLISLPPRVFSDPLPQHKNWAQAPISIRNQYPLSLPHLSLSPDSPEVLPQGKSSARFAYTLSNTFVPQSSYLVDAETRNLDLEFQHSFFENLEFGICVPVLWRGGGAMDPLIDSWHKFFHLPRGGRESVPDNEYSISGATRDSDFDFSNTGIGLGNISLSAKYLLTPGDKVTPAFSLFFELGTPTSRNNFGHTGFDSQLGILSSKRWGFFVLYAGASSLFIQDTKINEVEYESIHGEGFLQGEFVVSPAFSLLLGVYGGSKSINNIPGHPSSSLYLDTGAKYAPNSNFAFEFLLREDLGDDETDVSFLIGVVVTAG